MAPKTLRTWTGIVPNFVRVETFGARNTHWVGATIDPSKRSLCWYVL